MLLGSGSRSYIHPPPRIREKRVSGRVRLDGSVIRISVFIFYFWDRNLVFAGQQAALLTHTTVSSV